MHAGSSLPTDRTRMMMSVTHRDQWVSATGRYDRRSSWFYYGKAGLGELSGSRAVRLRSYIPARPGGRCAVGITRSLAG